MAARELKDGLLVGNKDRDMYIWVDVFGMALVMQRDRKVHLAVPYQWIASWAIDGDLFKVQLVTRKGKAKVRTFATGYSRAIELKDGLWKYVNLYLKNQEAVKTLVALSGPVEEGQVVPPEILDGVPPLNLEQFTGMDQGLEARISKAVASPAPAAAPGKGGDVRRLETESRVAREALSRAHVERDSLREEVAQLKQGLEEARKGGTEELEAAHAREAKEVAADRQRLLNLVASLEKENASLKESMGSEDLKKMADERSTLIKENDNLMSLLEEQHQLLNEQVTAVADLQGKLDTAQEHFTTAKEGKEAAEAVADAATRDAAEAVAAAQAASLGVKREDQLQAREKLGKLYACVGELQEQLQAVRMEAEGLKTALPLMGAMCMKQLQDWMATGAYSDMKDAVAKYKRECRLRKQLYNQLMELRGNIRVYCRVRPISAAEMADGADSVRFPQEDEITVLAERGPKSFEFDRVFSPESSQTQVFEDTAPLIASVLDGYNVCIFAYGQTGSGKTYTMEGPAESPGVNSRAINEVFRLAEERGEDYEVEISASMLEIYNETIRDLLVPRSAETQKLEVRLTGDGSVHVPNLSAQRVNQPSDIGSIMETARGNRSTFATNMNEHSSRSHMMLSVFVQSTNKVTGVVYRGKLHMVDLAGSERVSKSEVSGERLKEAQNINKSLSALGDVVSALSQKNQHVPFRNSKLTFVLQDSLGGDSKVLMFVQCSPAEMNVNETICSLNFAQRARTVELGKARQNVGPAGEAKGNMRKVVSATQALKRMGA